uniref:Uncharacterized protein n=1 Tax=Anguilla anguilla TaxID=7936 RepID=A0A0E9SZ98_ANGAN
MKSNNHPHARSQTHFLLFS